MSCCVLIIRDANSLAPKFDPCTCPRRKVVKRIQEPTVAAVRWTLGAVWRKVIWFWAANTG